MPDRNRLTKFAIGGIALLFLATFSVVGWLSYRKYQSEHAEQRREAAQHQADNSAKQGETLCVTIPRSRARACVTHPPDTEESAKHAEYDLRAQQDMAEWAYAMFLVTLGGLFVTVVGVIYVVRAFDLNARATDAATDAANTARSEFLSSRRPRFRIRRIGAVQIAPNSIVRASILVANVGESEGRGFEVGCDFFVEREPLIPVRDGRKQAYEMIIPQGKTADWIAPGKQILNEMDVADIQAGRATLAALILVNYRDMLGIQRSVSAYRHYLPSKRRFAHAPSDAEFAEWEYED